MMLKLFAVIFGILMVSSLVSAEVLSLGGTVTVSAGKTFDAPAAQEPAPLPSGGIIITGGKTFLPAPVSPAPVPQVRPSGSSGCVFITIGKTFD